MLEKNKITGAVLAGGKNTRMGTDKGLLLFRGKPFISHIIQAAEPLTKEVVIIGNTPVYDFLGYERIPDIIHDNGPLGGLYSLMKKKETPYFLLLSCDIPLVSTELLQRLLENDSKDVVYFQVGDFPMPLVAMYSRQSLEICKNCLEKGAFRMRQFLEKLNAKKIQLTASQESRLRNINTPEDYKNLI